MKPDYLIKNLPHLRPAPILPSRVETMGLPELSMKKFILLLFSCCFSLFNNQLDAQEPLTGANGQTEIGGTIKDALTGQGVQGATLRIGKLVEMSDSSGMFLLKGPFGSDRMAISHLGFRDTSILLTKISGLTDIFLVPEGNQIQEVEVVSTGYQDIPKERATGSFSSPDRMMYGSRIQSNVLEKIEGITSGLVFNSKGIRAPGDGNDMNIRGLSTIHSNSQPLIVLDNFPFEGNIESINPNDVESITVLKDAAAASIWGVRAGNGVIVINTKKNRVVTAPEISISSGLTYFSKPDLYADPNFISSSSYLELEAKLYDLGFYQNTLDNPGFPVISPYVYARKRNEDGDLSDREFQQMQKNWEDMDYREDLLSKFYRNQVKQQYFASLSGGNGVHRYYSSIGYDRNLQDQVRNRDQRTTIVLNDAYRIGDRWEIEGSFALLFLGSERNPALNNATSAFNGTLYPYASLTGSEPVFSRISPFYIDQIADRGFLDWRYFPMDELSDDLQTTLLRDFTVRANPRISYRILDNLKAELQYQYLGGFSDTETVRKMESFHTRNEVNRYSRLDPTGRVAGYNMPLGDIVSGAGKRTLSNQFRAQLNYQLKGDRFSMDAIAGLEARAQTITSETFTFYGYQPGSGSIGEVDHGDYFTLNPSGNASIPAGSSSNRYWDRFRSYYANVGMTYLDRYVLTGSARVDQSNFFGVRSNQRSVPLWSTGVKWNLSREGFLDKVAWFPQTVLRMTYGWSGNLDRSATAVTTLKVAGSFAELSKLPYANVSNYGNSSLRWEKVSTLNFGADIKAWKGRMDLSLDYYIKHGRDLMGQQILAPSSGLAEARGNFAQMTGKGLDMELGVQALNGPVSWNSNLLVSWTKDRITEYSAAALPSAVAGGGEQVSPVVGRPVYGIFSLPWRGLDPQTGDPQGTDGEGNISKDYHELVNPSDYGDLVYSGPARPTWFGGFRNTLSFRGMELSFNLMFKLGYFVRRSSVNYGQLYSSGRMHRDFEGRWTSPGDQRTTSTPSMAYPSDPNRDSFYLRSEALVESGSQIRFQDLSFSYSFPKGSSIFRAVRNPKLSFYMDNVGLLWKGSSLDLDPDFPRSGIPSSRSYALGISFNL